MTYDKLNYNIPAYQEGNVQDFEFDMDENFPISDVSDITFQARNIKGELLISKKKSSNEITLNDRVVRIPFSPAETKGKVGSHVYEIDFLNLEGEPFATIGGAFIVNREVNTL